ncbi:hypothetical protein A3715_00435 [Oleiphilus sp. HI0009]|nr:hypothetical protein A3715_00435 [Oleiphilus sp. HI0009]
MVLRRIAFVSAFFPSVAFSSFEAELGVEWRGFSESGLYGQDKSQTSGRLELGYDGEVLGGDYEVLLFGRYDRNDDERSHADLREAAYTYIGSNWSLKAGVSKVFWGVTESLHLVDIVNQTDGVESVDGEDKLGQPMVQFSSEYDWGTIDLFWLPYFRERTFNDIEGRLSLPLPIELDHAQYESGAEENHQDFAARYSHYIDDLDFAISHFSGTGRTPILAPNNPMAPSAFVPFYEQIDQTGLELQYIYESWLLKFEGISTKGIDSRYSAAVAGFEYTQVGIFDSYADLGWIAEYLYDDRKSDSRITFEQDVFVGWRYAFNDEDSSEILLGGILDHKTHERIYSLEASQRLTSDVKLFVNAWVFDGKPHLTTDPMDILNAATDSSQKMRFLQSEDHVQFELVKYF